MQVCVLYHLYKKEMFASLHLKASMNDDNGMVETTSGKHAYINFMPCVSVSFFFFSFSPYINCIMAADTDTAAPTDKPDIKEKGNTKDPEQKSLWARYALWLLVPIMLAVYFSQDSTVLAQTKHERQVLPDNVKPLHYDLELTPDLETFVYTGRVKIK